MVPAAHAANMKRTSYLSVTLLMKIDVCFHHLAASCPLPHSTYAQGCERWSQNEGFSLFSSLDVETLSADKLCDAFSS